MIISDMRHISQRLSLTSALKEAIDFLRMDNMENLADGRTAINGQRVFALVQRYETKKIKGEPKFEYHRKYIDIQYIVSGEEVIGWAPAERVAITEPYDSEKDVCFGRVPEGEVTPLYLRSGQMAVLYPEDGHAPGLAAERPSKVMKVVIKIAVEE
jgi:biofilm protein TabA